MKKRLAALVLGGLFLLVATPAMSAKKVKWDVPIAFGSKLEVLGSSAVKLSDFLKDASGKKIRLKIVEPGKIVPAFQIFDAVKNGKVKAGFSWAGYWQGKIPAAALFASMPFGPEPSEYLAWLHEGNGMKLWRELYAKHNIVPVQCGILPPETSGWFKTEITSPDDLKGKKIRWSGLGGKVLANMGVSVVQIPGGELFQAAEKGVIDAFEFSMPAIDRRLGFYKIIKNNYYPGWHQPASPLELLVNKETWDKLEDEQRAMIEMGCMAVNAWAIARGEAIQAEFIEQNEKDGVNNRYWSESMLDAFRKSTDEVMKAESAKDADFKRVYEDMQAFRASYKNWSKLGYMPR